SAFAHVGNPCGHSFCGECGYQWLAKNRNDPTCSLCRAKLSTETPMIPNYAMDSTVEKYVKSLALSGQEAWQEGGEKLDEWHQRKECAICHTSPAYSPR
ncbi:hypothetical protein FA95DRAFT_1486787, partial [Auriscalpium vulgare]